MDSNLINLKCIDDFNNKLSLLLKKNINNLLEITNINYTIDIPQIYLFSESNLVKRTLHWRSPGTPFTFTKIFIFSV